MQKEFFSKREIKELNKDADKLVKSNFSDANLFKSVKQRTQILIYSMPQKYYYITEEKAADVYLKLEDKLDKIIHSYRLNSSYDYISYIINISKYASKNIYTAIAKEEATTKYVLKCELDKQAYYCIDEPVDDITLKSTCNKYKASSTYLNDIDSIYTLVKDTCPINHYDLSPELNSLSHLIQQERYKEGLFLYILANSNSVDEEMQKYYSVLFNLPTEVFSKLSTLMYNIIDGREKVAHVKIEKERLDKTWARYLMLEREYTRWGNKNIKDIEDRLAYLKGKIKKKQFSLSQAKVGLTYREIGHEINYSSSHICTKVLNIKKKLKQINNKYSIIQIT